MKLFTGLIVLAVAAIVATGAQAQVPAPYGIDSPAIAASDLSEFYAAMPSGPVEDYGPRLDNPRAQNKSAPAKPGRFRIRQP